jgi:hypothetical protein
MASACSNFYINPCEMEGRVGNEDMPTRATGVMEHSPPLLGRMVEGLVWAPKGPAPSMQGKNGQKAEKSCWKNELFMSFLW